MNLEDAIKIETAEPDSQFRLRSCPECGSDNVAYVQYILGIQEPWKVRCFDCGFTADRHAMFRHEAQIHWNKTCRDLFANPCKDCPDRYHACSDHCTKLRFRAWKAQQENIRKNKKNYQCPVWKHGDRDPRKG